MKKITAIIMSAVMVLLMSVTSFAAFTDMPQGADGEVLQKAVDDGLIQGFGDNTVRPQTPITRAQMATIMSRAMKAVEKADISAFVDVKAGDWYYDAMSQAVSMEAFKGDDKKQLNPNKTITRQEALIVLCRIFDVPDSDKNALGKYSDGSKVASWAAVEVRSMAAAGYLGNTAEIRPLDAMTRLEFAQIMDRIVTTYIDESGEYTNLPAGNILVRAENVTLKGIKTDNVIFIGDGVESEVNFTDCAVERIIARGKKAVINSGTYAYIRAIGNGTQVILKKMPMELVKKYADGKFGKFYAKPGKGTIIPPAMQG